MSALREVLEQACLGSGCAAKGLTVLSPQVDPYRIDNAVGHANGQWLADQIQRLGLRWRFHLRGLHYALVAAGDVIKPNGAPYSNTQDDWEWLIRDAGKAARWLGYVECAIACR